MQSDFPFSNNPIFWFFFNKKEIVPIKDVSIGFLNEPGIWFGILKAVNRKSCMSDSKWKISFWYPKWMDKYLTKNGLCHLGNILFIFEYYVKYIFLFIASLFWLQTSMYSESILRDVEISFFKYENWW